MAEAAPVRVSTPRSIHPGPSQPTKRTATGSPPDSQRTRTPARPAQGLGHQGRLHDPDPCDGFSPCTAAVDQNRIDTNIWITDQLDFTSPTVSYVDAESVVAVTDTASTADPQALKLGNDTAPADFDSGDHVNLTTDGYQAISDSFDLASLGPDA